jgi:hypothetical protein
MSELKQVPRPPHASTVSLQQMEHNLPSFNLHNLHISYTIFEGLNKQ